VPPARYLWACCSFSLLLCSSLYSLLEWKVCTKLGKQKAVDEVVDTADDETVDETVGKTVGKMVDETVITPADNGDGQR